MKKAVKYRSTVGVDVDGRGLYTSVCSVKLVEIYNIWKKKIFSSVFQLYSV